MFYITHINYETDMIMNIIFHHSWTEQHLCFEENWNIFVDVLVPNCECRYLVDNLVLFTHECNAYSFLIDWIILIFVKLTEISEFLLLLCLSLCKWGAHHSPQSDIHSSVDILLVHLDPELLCVIVGSLLWCRSDGCIYRNPYFMTCVPCISN